MFGPLPALVPAFDLGKLQVLLSCLAELGVDEPAEEFTTQIEGRINNWDSMT